MGARLSPLIGNDVRIFAVCCHILTSIIIDFSCHSYAVIIAGTHRVMPNKTTVTPAIPANNIRPLPSATTLLKRESYLRCIS